MLSIRVSVKKLCGSVCLVMKKLLRKVLVMKVSVFIVLLMWLRDLLFNFRLLVVGVLSRKSGLNFLMKFLLKW